jgi:DNA-binding MarR family transcriptional regulator
MAAARAESSASAEATRVRRRQVAEAKQALRDLRIELAALNHQVGLHIDLRDVDLDCLDVITRHGPISPSALARRVGVHLATMTGILARLEDGGWITRERLDTDRRAVLVRAVPGRQRSIFQQYDGMNRSLDDILDRLPDENLEIIVDFLRRCTAAGRSATDELAADSE